MVLTVALVAALAAAGVTGWLAYEPSGGPPGKLPPSLAWTSAQAPLPAGGKSRFATLLGVDCPAAGTCVAVGSYSPPGSREPPRIDGLPLIETLSDGRWTASGKVAGAPVTELAAVSCPAAGSCVAFGIHYSTEHGRNGGTDPVAARLSGGRWTAITLPLPSDSLKGRLTQVSVSDVDCPAPGTCVATGAYLDQAYHLRPLIETLSDGKWTGIPAPLPAGAAAINSAQDGPLLNLAGVACPAVSSCIATGQYYKRDGTLVPLTETLSGRRWTPAAAPLPKAGQSGGLYDSSCRAPRSCVAVGSYEIRKGELRYLTETLSGGTWTPANPPLPASAQATQEASHDPYSGLYSVACRAAGSCVALGPYVVRGGALEFAIDTLSGGTWTAMKAPLPTGVETSNPNFPSIAVACPSADSCVAVGGYIAKSGTGGLAVIETARPEHR